MKKKYLILGILLVLFGAGIYYFFSPADSNLSKSDQNTALQKMLGRKVRTGEDIKTGNQTYNGKYFSLTYPAYAKVYDRENTNITGNKNILEYLRLDSEEPKFKFVVLVQRGEGAALDELSGVRTRRPNERYVEKQLRVGDLVGVLFVKESDEVEHSSFFLKDGKIYSFSVTGLDASALEAETVPKIQRVKIRKE